MEQPDSEDNLRFLQEALQHVSKLDECADSLQAFPLEKRDELIGKMLEGLASLRRQINSRFPPGPSQ